MKPRQKAFSLIELLVLVAIIGLMTALVIPSVTGILRGGKLSTGIETVFGALTSARQLAATKNREIEFRLLEMQDPSSPGSSSEIRAVQLFEICDNNVLKQIGKMSVLPPGVIIGSPAEMTSLSALPNATPSATDPSIPRIARNYKYRSFRFRPDGSLNLNLLLPTVSTYFLTLYDEKFKPAGATPPANFATIQLEPNTGAALLYRP